MPDDGDTGFWTVARIPVIPVDGDRELLHSLGYVAVCYNIENEINSQLKKKCT